MWTFRRHRVECWIWVYLAFNTRCPLVTFREGPHVSNKDEHGKDQLRPLVIIEYPQMTHLVIRNTLEAQVCEKHSSDTDPNLQKIRLWVVSTRLHADVSVE